MSQKPDRFIFRGFQKPNYTPVPDELFDELMPFLSGAELKVLLYIVRKTFGWKKDSDNISINQMLNGIERSNGELLDHGVGLTKKTLLLALNSLEDKNIIVTQRRQSREHGWEPTTYRLNVAGALGVTIPPSLGEKLPQGVGEKSPPRAWGKNYPIQETALQETRLQETESKSLRHSSSEISHSTRKGIPRKMQEVQAAEPTAQPSAVTTPRGFTAAGTLLRQRQQRAEPSPELQAPRASGPEPRSRRRNSAPATPFTTDQQVIQAYIADLRTRFRDFASLTSSSTRAYHLYEQARETHPVLDIGTFTGLLEQAASITTERGGELRYLFSVVESLLWPEEQRPLRDTTGYHQPRRRKTVGGPLVRVVPLRVKSAAEHDVDAPPDGPAMAPEGSKSGQWEGETTKRPS